MPPSFTLHGESDGAGARRVALTGSVTLRDGASLWRELGRAFAQADTIELDVGGVDRMDGGSAALVNAIVTQRRAAGSTVEVVNASHDTARMLRMYECAAEEVCGREHPRHPGMITEVGNSVVGLIESGRAILEFCGDLTIGAVQAVRRPRTVHFGQFGTLIERAGADGLPIVLLINYLVGAILGLQGAIQLHRFGGDQFLADLVGLSVVRELGPLMTAILVTGRSGAAYAAELGTMTVNEEVDALRTLGQDPHRFLVFPRVLTLLIVVPLLTLLGNLVACLGGLSIALTYLDQPTIAYLTSLQQAISLGDIGSGLLKSLGFSFAIGLIACQRGLATRGGADGVGRATTSAVVVSLFSLVVLDALFTWLFTRLDW